MLQCYSHVVCIYNGVVVLILRGVLFFSSAYLFFCYFDQNRCTNDRCHRSRSNRSRRKSFTLVFRSVGGYRQAEPYKSSVCCRYFSLAVVWPNPGPVPPPSCHLLHMFIVYPYFGANNSCQQALFTVMALTYLNVRSILSIVGTQFPYRNLYVRCSILSLL